MSVGENKRSKERVQLSPWVSGRLPLREVENAQAKCRVGIWWSILNSFSEKANKYCELSFTFQHVEQYAEIPKMGRLILKGPTKLSAVDTQVWSMSAMQVRPPQRTPRRDAVDQPRGA